MENRFEVNKEKTGRMTFETKIIVDKKTGVQYLYAGSGYGGGITVLVDKDGKPLLADGYYR